MSICFLTDTWAKVTRAKTREARLERNLGIVAIDRNTDLEFLLVKADRHEELMRVQVYVVGDSHSTINHTELLNLELGDIKGLRGSRAGRAVVNPEGRCGLQLARYLYLLGKRIGTKRDIEAIRSWRTPDGDDNVGILVARKITTSGAVNGRAAELEDGLGLGLRADLAKGFSQQLLACHEVLTRTSHAEANLLDGRVRLPLYAFT